MINLVGLMAVKLLALHWEMTLKLFGQKIVSEFTTILSLSMKLNFLWLQFLILSKNSHDVANFST